MEERRIYQNQSKILKGTYIRRYKHTFHTHSDHFDSLWHGKQFFKHSESQKERKKKKRKKNSERKRQFFHILTLTLKVYWSRRRQGLPKISLSQYKYYSNLVYQYFNVCDGLKITSSPSRKYMLVLHLVTSDTASQTPESFLFFFFFTFCISW